MAGEQKQTRLTPEQDRLFRTVLLASRRVAESLEQAAGEFGWLQEVAAVNSGFEALAAADHLLRETDELKRQADRMHDATHELRRAINRSTTGNG